MSKCFNCQEPRQDGMVYCEDCLELQEAGKLEVKTTGTYIIFDKI